MPKYRVNELTALPDRLVEAGTIIDFDHPPDGNLDAIDVDGAKAKVARAEEFLEKSKNALERAKSDDAVSAAQAAIELNEVEVAKAKDVLADFEKAAKKAAKKQAAEGTDLV